MISKKIYISFLIFLVIFAVSGIIFLKNDYVLCPMYNLGSRAGNFDVYLALDEENQPCYIEVQEIDYKFAEHFRDEEVIARAYGCEKVDMILDFDGAFLNFYSDSLRNTPDTSLYFIDFKEEYGYHEFDLRK